MVTVVFADLAGFTAMAEGRDPEAVKELLDRCFSGLVPVIEAHGGVVDKIIGDELMAVFGAPVAHEDDPERAVRAALALVDAIESIAPGQALRIGVNTGEVLAGPVGPGRAYTVTGDAVNTAHRLASVADVGEVLVADRTRTATAGSIGFEARPPYQLRGKQAAVVAWAAVGTSFGPGLRSAVGTATPLVGREDEQAQLESVISTAFGRPQATVAVVTGEPGVGKTRLTIDFVIGQMSRPEPPTVLWTSCPPYGSGSGLQPLGELMRIALDVDPKASRPAQLDQLGASLAPLADDIGADRALLTARLAQLLGLHDLPRRVTDADPGPTRARVVDQLVSAAHQVLLGLAGRRPVLVVVDDLHWADDAVLGFLERLPHRLGAVPLLAITMARDELLERRGELGRGRAGEVPLPLVPLADAAASELLAAALTAVDRAVDDGPRPTTPGWSGPRLGPATERRLLAAAGGNPLLLEQLVRYLVEAGALVDRNGRWHADLDRVGIPDGVRSLIGARIDALPPDERELLRMASIIGPRFWVDAVAALVDLGDPRALVRSLLARGLVERLVDDPGPGEYAFRHVLTRDVAYAAVPLAERAHRHAQVAAWMREAFGHDGAVGPHAGLLAHQYERAVVLSRELEHTDPGLAGAAFAALVRAAREAERRDAFQEAERWYARARELGTFEEVATLEIVLAHGIVLVELRRLDDARSAFDLVRRRAAAPGATDATHRLALRATSWLAVTARLDGDTEAARQLFDEAQRAWRDNGDLSGEADTQRLQGWGELTAGRARAAKPKLRRAFELERLSPSGPQGETLQALGWAEFLVGDTEAAREHLWAAAERYAACDDEGGMNWCFGILGFSFLQAGRVVQACEIAENLLAQARVQGDPWSEGTCMILLAAGRVYAGEVDAGARLAADAGRCFEELGDPWGRTMSGLLLAMAGRARGERQAARSRLREALAIAGRVTHVGEDARILAELAQLEADDGEVDEASRRARAALALVRAGIGDQDSGLRALVVLAGLAGRSGDHTGAQLLLGEAVAMRTSTTATDTWRQANAELALTLVADGDTDAAALLAAAAADGADESVRTLALAQRALASVAASEGRTEDAVAVLESVLAGHGHRPLVYLDDVRADLAEITATPLPAGTRSSR